MSRLQIGDLGPLSETLLFTLYLRAAESRRRDAILRDDQAVQLVDGIDYDFSRYRGTGSTQVTTALRSAAIDRALRVFLAEHPTGLIVDIGCGLDTRFSRIDNGAMSYIGLDMPDVIDLRRRLIPDAPRCRSLACSALDLRWLDHLDAHYGRPVFFVCEGVLMYLETTGVKSLVVGLRERCPGSELMFDIWGPFQSRLLKLIPAGRKVGVSFHWYVSRPNELESWAPGIRLLSEWYYFDQDEPRLGMMRLMGLVPAWGKGYMILHYRLG